MSCPPSTLPRGASPTAPLQEWQLPGALRLSQALAWPYRLEDWQDALRLGQGFGVEVDGALRATALWWPWGERFATCGMIIVDGALQGRGIGRALMVDLLEAAGARTLLLRSTVAGRRLYEQLGFVECGRIHQHQATLPVRPLLQATDDLRAMQASDADALRELDRAASGMDRERLLDALFAAGEFIVSGPPARPPTGYACIRRWGRGCVIGPVVATDAGAARQLVAAAVQRHGGEFLRIDVTGESGLSPWLEDLGLPCVDRVTSMARGPLPRRSSDATLFTLASQSLG